MSTHLKMPGCCCQTIRPYWLQKSLSVELPFNFFAPFDWAGGWIYTRYRKQVITIVVDDGEVSQTQYLHLYYPGPQPSTPHPGLTATGNSDEEMDAAGDALTGEASESKSATVRTLTYDNGSWTQVLSEPITWDDQVDNALAVLEEKSRNGNICGRFILSDLFSRRTFAFAGESALAVDAPVAQHLNLQSGWYYDDGWIHDFFIDNGDSGLVSALGWPTTITTDEHGAPVAENGTTMKVGMSCANLPSGRAIDCLDIIIPGAQIFNSATGYFEPNDCFQSAITGPALVTFAPQNDCSLERWGNAGCCP